MLLSGNGRHRATRRSATQRLVSGAGIAGIVSLGIPLAFATGASAAPATAATAADVTSAPAAAAPAAVAAVPTSATTSTAPATYTVVSGDWLSSIAEKENVSGGWQELYNLNKSTLTQGPNLIFPGEQLVLSGTASSDSSSQSSAATTTTSSSDASSSDDSSGAQSSDNSSDSGSSASTDASSSDSTAATTSSSSSTDASTSNEDPQAIAAQIVPADQLASFDEIISHESGWDVTATNPSSGAYGLPQALPGDKMASEGADWQTDATTQLEWALNYMNTTYGSPNQAWVFWQANNWY